MNECATLTINLTKTAKDGTSTTYTINNARNVVDVQAVKAMIEAFEAKSLTS